MASPDDKAALLRCIGKDGRLILGPEIIQRYIKTAASQKAPKRRHLQRVPGVMATRWYHRFFGHMAPCLRNPVDYQNAVNAYHDVASVFAELEGRPPRRNADLRTGAIAAPPPFEKFAIDAGSALCDDREHVQSCKTLVIQTVIHEIGLIQRQLGLAHPEIEIWLAKALAALQRTKDMLYVFGPVSMEELKRKFPASAIDAEAVGEEARASASVRGHQKTAWEVKRKAPEELERRKAKVMKIMAENKGQSHARRPKYQRPVYSLQGHIIKGPVVKRGGKKVQHLIIPIVPSDSDSE